MSIAGIATRLHQRTPKVIGVAETQRQKGCKEGERGRALTMRPRCRIVERTVRTLEGTAYLADMQMEEVHCRVDGRVV